MGRGNGQSVAQGNLLYGPRARRSGPQMPLAALHQRLIDGEQLSVGELLLLGQQCVLPLPEYDAIDGYDAYEQRLDDTAGQALAARSRLLIERHSQRDGYINSDFIGLARAEGLQPSQLVYGYTANIDGCRRLTLIAGERNLPMAITSLNAWIEGNIASRWQPLDSDDPVSEADVFTALAEQLALDY